MKHITQNQKFCCQNAFQVFWPLHQLVSGVVHLNVLIVLIKYRNMAEMLIKHKAKPSAYTVSRLHTKCFICVKHKQGNVLTISNNFQRNTLIKMCLLAHCNLNGGSLIYMHEL